MRIRVAERQNAINNSWTKKKKRERTRTHSQWIEGRIGGRMSKRTTGKNTLATIFVQFTVKVFEREWKIAYNDNRCTKLSMKAKPKQQCEQSISFDCEFILKHIEVI